VRISIIVTIFAYPAAWSYLTGKIRLTTGARSGTLTVAGGVSIKPTSVTMKDNNNSPAATVYEDNTFARQNVTLLDNRDPIGKN
jgi:hypothetical protein